LDPDFEVKKERASKMLLESENMAVDELEELSIRIRV